MTGMSSMAMGDMPDAVRAAWIVAMCGVLVVHGGHVVTHRGALRWWHAGHILMAAGMVVMFLPVPMTPTATDAGVLVFACAAAAAVGYTGLARDRAGMVDSVWLLSAVDMIVMVCMFLPPTSTPGWLDVVLISYLIAASVLWATGLLPRWAAARATARGSSGGGVLVVVREDLAVHCTPGIRITLAVMTAGMATMMAVM